MNRSYNSLGSVASMSKELKAKNNSIYQVLGLIALRKLGWKTSEYLRLIQASSEPTEFIDKINNSNILKAFYPHHIESDIYSICLSEIIEWENKNIQVVALGEHSYPAALMHLEDPPAILFYQGDISALNDKFPVSIVGSRKADKKGTELASQVALELARSSACIVSGLAIGIDASAHQGALCSNVTGSTVAVLGNGLGNVYPARHKKLSEQIIESGGAIISQFEPGTPPYPSNFLNRNRVIAALSEATLVVQAALRSGALSTARIALELGREVMACPGWPNDRLSLGCNKILKQGAYLVTDAKDIIELFPENLRSEVKELKEGAHFSKNQFKIIKLLKDSNDVHIESFQNIENGESELLELELEGVIERLPGNRVRLKM